MRLAAVLTSTLLLTSSFALADQAPKEKAFLELKPVSQTPAAYRPNTVNKPVFAVAPQLEPCGTTTAKNYPMLKLGIAADGTVSSVAVKPATAFTADALACIDKVMRQATFPPRKGNGTTVTFAMLYR